MAKKGKKKVVVTGGAGFIGSHLVDELALRGYDVHIIDNLSQSSKKNVNREATFHKIDIGNYDDVASVVAHAHCVFHLAALPRVQYSIEHPLETNEVNVSGTVNVLTASQRGGARRVVYSASSSAYGDQKVMPLHEDMPPNPKSPYGLQKYIGELQCKMWSQVYGLSTVSLRYFNVYGPRFNPEGAYALVIGKFLKQKKEGLPLTITGDGSQTRDFTHVSDVVFANILAMDSNRAGDGEVFNVGAGNNVSIKKIAHMIGGPVEYIDARLEPKHTKADNRKAKKTLGWEPQISIEDGIAHLKELYL